jgi:hypothetical protein
MRTQRLIAYTFAACLLSLTAGTAMADDGSGHFNALLNGKYQFNINQSCATSIVDSPPGFNGVVSIGPGESNPAYFTGVITFDGHGNATQTDHGIYFIGPQLRTGGGTAPVGTFVETCQYTYRVARDGSFSYGGSCTATDGSYKLSNDTWKGQIALGGLVLLTNQVVTDVSTLEFPAGGPISQYRICGSVGTLVRIQPQ